MRDRHIFLISLFLLGFCHSGETLHQKGKCEDACIIEGRKLITKKGETQKSYLLQSVKDSRSHFINTIL